MKNNQILWGGVDAPAYEAPMLSLEEVKVESGFASSFETGQTPEFEEDKIEW